LIEQVDPAGNGLPAEYEIPFTSLDVVNMLKDVNKDTDVTPEYVEQAVASQVNPNSVFTLTEVTTTEQLEEIKQSIEPNVEKVIYWGNAATGEGVKLAELVNQEGVDLFGDLSPELSFDQLTAILGQIKTITQEGVLDNLQGAGVDAEDGNYAVVAGDSNTITVDPDGNITIEQTPEAKAGDYTGNYQIVLNVEGADVINGQIVLTQQQFDYLNSVLFDGEGNSRLFEVEEKTWPKVAMTQDGTLVFADSTGEYKHDDGIILDGADEPFLFDLKEIVTQKGETVTTKHPLVLTPSQNNGGTQEQGFTTDLDDTIIAGRLDLLHQAYIDGGKGYDVLQVDAKGYFAQPLALLNIEEVQVQNLPNIYGENSEEYPDFADPEIGNTNEVATASILDLSRATEIEKLVVTEGGYNDLGDDVVGNGPLTITGIRNGAETTLDGGFTRAVTLNYGEGQGDGIDLVFNNLDLQAAFNVAHNANTLNIESTGGGNQLISGNPLGANLTLGGSISTMNIAGDAHLYIADNLNNSFRNSNPATIDASENTGGVNLELSNFDDQITFTGTANADDRFVADGNTAGTTVGVIIEGGDGDNWFSATGATNQVEITTGNGNNQIDAGSAETVTVTAGDGNSVITASSTNDDTNVTVGAGNNEITATSATGTATVNTGDGDNTIDTSGSENAVVNTGAGDDTIMGIGNTTSTINAGAGDNTMTLSGEAINVTAAEGNDVLTLAGTAGELPNAGAAGLNLMLVLDESGSMNGEAITALKAGLNGLFDDLIAKGVNTSALSIAFASSTDSSGWGSLQQARTFVDALDPSGGTDFDIALTNAITAWGQSGKIDGATNVSLFVSDDNESITDAGDWQDFLTNEGILSLAVGLDVNSAGGLADIAFDGTTGQSIAPSLTDAEGLASVLDDVGIDLTGNAGKSAVVNIDLGEGENTLNLGDGDQLSQGLTALEGSSISGDNITLIVNADSDLRAADLTDANITSVVLDDAMPSASRDADNALLTLTAEQFEAIGAANFSVEGASFDAAAQIKLIITESTSLTDLGVDDLPSNIDLQLELRDGVTLEMTARQLHEKVAANGVTLADDGNTDLAPGDVYITEAGNDFDPIGGIGGSLSNGVSSRIEHGGEGFERPVQIPENLSRWVHDSDEDGAQITADASNADLLRLTGESDLTMVPVKGGIDDWGRFTEEASAIELNVENANAVDAEDRQFYVDFSALEGQLNGLTLARFEDVAAVYGNGNDARVNVELSDSVGTETKGLASRDVQTYVVTDINDTGNADGDGKTSTANFYTCETTQDLETLGLQGNYGNTINFLNTERGVEFLMEVEYAKTDGYAVGTLFGEFARPGAAAVVNVVGLDALPAGETQKVAGIELINAATATINVEGGNTEVETLNTSAVTELTVNADANLTLPELDADLEVFDASGVTGELVATIDPDADAALEFVGAEGSTNLTILAAEEGAIDSIDGAGEITLTIGDDDEVNLSETTLSNVTSVAIHEGQSLTLTMEQADVIGSENFSVIDTDGNGTIASTSLTLEGLNDQPFSLADYPEGLEVTLTLANEPVVTLHPDTDLTGIAALNIPEGTVLELTAEQFQQLEGVGSSHATLAEGTVLYGTGSVHITDMTQKSVGENGKDLDLSTIAIADATGGSTDGVATVTISLAETVNLSAATVLDTNGNPVADTFNIGDGLTLVLEGIEDADGVEFVGGAESTLKFTDIANDATDGSIDASKFGTTYVQLLNALVADANIDLLLDGLPGSVTKVIYNGDGWVTTLDQVANVEPETTVDGFVAFDTTNPEVEIANFTLNLQGAADITGNLDLTTGAKFNDADGDRTQDTGEANRMRAFLQSLTINSTDETEESDATNLLTGETANIIGGKVTATDESNGADSGRLNNNLLNVTITGDQALVIEGGIEFSSVVGDDDFTANDNEEAVATLNVESSASVELGALDISDVDVDALIVNHTGSGDLTITLNPDLVDQAANNNDSITINGSATAQTTIVVADGDDNANDGLDLSDDTLVNVDAIVLEEWADLTLTQEQFNDIGVAGFSLAEENIQADINLVEFEGAVPFNATALQTGINIETITMAPGAQVMDPATNLTGVAQIVVPEGGSLTLTADQFAQLDGTGSIVGVGGTQDFTVTITGLDQADVNAGLNLAGIDSTNIIVDVDGSVNLHDTTVLGTVGNLTFQLDDNAILGLAEIAQLSPTTTATNGNGGVWEGNSVEGSGLSVTGGTGTAVELQFINGFGPYNTFDASGISVDFLRVLNDLVDNRDVELLQDIDSDVTVVVYTSPDDMPGYVASITRDVIVEAGTTVAGFMVFNDYQDDSEVVKLNITMEGDATINGNLRLSTVEKDADLVARYFDTLTINSEGSDVNTITGNITPMAINSDTLDNNLLDVVINAAQDFVVGGSIVFNSRDEDGDDDDAATLILTGDADVTVQQLDVSDDDITTLNIANDGDGTFTATGASPALFDDANGDGAYATGNPAEVGNLETLNLTGTGNIVFGSNDGVTTEWGISAGALSTIDASGLSGALDLGEVRDIDSANFEFTAGTGVTTLTLTSDTLDADSADTGWSFDFTNATGNSEFHLGSDAGSSLTFTDGPLTIDLGANTTLYIDESMDLTDLDLSITQTLDIVLADGVELTLTAEQADGLNIVEATGATASVFVEDLNGSPVDLSGISATTLLATLDGNDETMDAATDLGDFAIGLKDIANASATGAIELAGQTIRFATEEQAGREVIVLVGSNSSDTQDGFTYPEVASTNVVWLFDSVSGPVNTDAYDPDLARVWFYEGLVNGANVENLFTSLPNSILRVEVETLEELDAPLSNSSGAPRTLELVAFTELPGGLVFSDQDQLEHVESLTIDMGGEVTVGDIMIGNIVNPETGVNSGSVTFNTLTINSVLADDTGDLLASENFDETIHVKPVGPNVVGNIGVGANDNGNEFGLDLTTVVLNTGVAESGNNLSANTGGTNDVLTGTALQTGTITFDSESVDDPDTAVVETATATLVVDGANDITIASVDTSDTEIGTLIVHDVDFTGTLTAPGASPAFMLDNTEALYFGSESGQLSGEDDPAINLGSEDNAGIVGNELSLIAVTGGYATSVESTASEFRGTVNLGVIADIDRNDDDDDGDGIITADEYAFTLVGNDSGSVGPNTTATLGAANGRTPTLEAGNTWSFSDVNLTITDEVVFETPVLPDTEQGNLIMNNVNLTIEGDVDLTQVDLDLTNVSIFVPADQTLILTVEQVKALDTAGFDVTGSGTVEVIGNGDDATASIFNSLRTANVDLSAVVLTEDDANDVFSASFISGLDDANEVIGQTITGSTDFANAIYAGEDDDTLIGGTGDDTLYGRGGSDTFEITAGSDIVMGLHSQADDENENTTEEQDVLIVSSGASVTAENIVEFVATAETINRGTATLTAASGGATIDVSLAGGSNGFTLNGGATGGTFLTGSDNADTLSGGTTAQANGSVDVLAGGAGADRFEFTTITSEPAELSTETLTEAYDEAWVTVTAADGNEAETIETLTITYQVNNIVNAVVVSLAGVDLTNAADVATEIRNTLDAIAGVDAAISDSDPAVVEAWGLTGNRFDIDSVTYGDTTGGTFGVVEDNTPGTDDAQVELVTITDDTPIVEGEIYTLLVKGKDGIEIGEEGVGVTYEAQAGDTVEEIAAGLATALDAADTLNRYIVTANDIGNGAGTIEIEAADADIGGFTVTWPVAPVGSFEGSSASGTGLDLMDGNIDIITDFMSGTDELSLGLAAGTAVNFATGAEVAWSTEIDNTFAAALSDANDAFVASAGDLQYYLTSLADDGVENEYEGTGVLFFDANQDGEADGAIYLVGIDENNFVFGDIVA
jgi:hypothetical protein